MKKIVALVLSAIMAVTLLAACGNGGGATKATETEAPTKAEQKDTTATAAWENETVAEEEIDYDSELTVGITSDIGSFYPGGSGSAGVKIKRIMCYETFFYRDAEKELYPLVAKSYTDKGNGVYEIELFDYVSDSAGNPFTAADCVFSFDKYIEDGQNSSTWATITDYKAVSDYVFQFTVNPETTGQVKDILSRIPLVTQKAWEDSGDDLASCPCGTGGYTLNLDESVSGSLYVFNRRDDYWQTDKDYICGKNKNYIKKLTVKVITDTSTLASALQTGEVDFTSELESIDWGLFIDTETGAPLDGYTAMQGQNNAFIHMTFNCGPNSPCQDIKLRQAICYCIDSAACAFSVYGALGEVCRNATNPYLLDSGHQFDMDDYYDYDLEKAKQLVKESSYNGETLQMLVLPKTTVSASAPLIQAYALQIGVNIELLEYDMATFRKVRTETTGEVYDIELMGATSADDYVYVSIKEIDNRAYGNGMGRTFVPDDKLQELYENVGNQVTTSEEGVQALLDHLYENCYAYGIYFCPKQLIGKDIIKGGEVVAFDDAIYTSFVIDRD